MVLRACGGPGEVAFFELLAGELAKTCESARLSKDVRRYVSPLRRKSHVDLQCLPGTACASERILVGLRTMTGTLGGKDGMRSSNATVTTMMSLSL